jgi:hypothetical protein
MISIDRRRMMIISMRKFDNSLFEAREFTYCAHSFVVVDRTSVVTLVRRFVVVVVVVALIQTQRHDYTGCYTGAATFISMLRLQGSSSHGFRGSTAIDGLL